MKENEKERVPTGIEGLDSSMHGGFIRGSINLLGGSPGSGKSILAMQYIINGAMKYNEPGVYITFEEEVEKLKENMQNFGWDLEKLEEEGKIAIIKLSPSDIEPSPLDSSNRISESDSAIKRNVIKKIHAKRIVIDSISAYSLSYPDEASRRRSHFELFRMLREWGCTSLLIAEYDIDEHKSTPLDFQCDSIIWLYNKKKEGVRIRSVEIVKMRGTKHSTKTSAVEISDNGIKVYPNEVVY